MQQEQLRFIVANDPEHDFDLMLEAYRGNELIADVHKVEMNWEVRFFVENMLREISWENFTRVYKTFSQFIAEMTVPKEAKRDEIRP